MDSVFSMYAGIFGRLNGYQGDKIGRDVVGPYTIDTCDTCDQGFETAIWKDKNSMEIVERYSSSQEASSGHEKWIAFCKTNPKSVYSVQCDCECVL